MSRVSEQQPGYVRVMLEDGAWKTPGGEVVPWYEVRTDLLPAAEVEAAIDRVLSVYGVSDVVVDAFREFRKELPGAGSPPTVPE